MRPWKLGKLDLKKPEWTPPDSNGSNNQVKNRHPVLKTLFFIFFTSDKACHVGYSAGDIFINIFGTLAIRPFFLVYSVTGGEART